MMLAHEFCWQSAADFRRDMAGNDTFISTAENFIRQHETLSLYCDFCKAVGPMQVDVGPNFGDGYPNLREGMLCACGAKNRDRLMKIAVGKRLLRHHRVVAFGSQGRFPDWLREIHPDTIFCEYFGAKHAAGARVETDNGPVLNQDLCGATFEDGSVDILIHCDVLEHVPNVARAAQECARLLAPGGRSIFTMPFFQALESTIVRARLDADGQVEHLLPPEIHGDPMQPAGALAFYNFGWDLLDHFRAAGLQQTSVHMTYDAFQGLVSNGCQYPEMNMLPVYCVSTKS